MRPVSPSNAAAQAATRGESLGAELLAYAIDQFPVFRAPNRTIAKKMKRTGYTFNIWRARDWWNNAAGESRVRGWH